MGLIQEIKTNRTYSPEGSMRFPYLTGQKQLGHWRTFSKAELDTHIQLPAQTDQSASSKYL